MEHESKYIVIYSKNNMFRGLKKRKVVGRLHPPWSMNPKYCLIEFCINTVIKVRDVQVKNDR